jgi:hypothetical protein
MRTNKLSLPPPLLLALVAGLLQWIGPLAIPPAQAAAIGILADGRQSPYLSLLGDSSALARLALAADGHQLAELHSLAPAVINTVDVLWLPLLETSSSYTAQERADLAQYVVNGGAIVWIGDADVFNASDDSFLTAFGMSKQTGNLDLGLVPAIAGHPVITGPHSTVSLVGTNAGYGLFTGTPQVAGVFVNDGGSGIFAGFLDPTSGFGGGGRIAFICDSSIFGQLLDNDSHRPFLRNVVKWAAAMPGYTPSGASASTGGIPGACAACSSVEVVFEVVTATGETAVQSIGDGRCYFADIPYSALPADFLGYAFAVQTTAITPPQTDMHITVTYDPAVLTALGIADQTALTLLRYDSSEHDTINITTALDTAAHTVAGQTLQLGSFLFGAVVPAADCNDNDLPDVCEIDHDSTAPGGPFYCLENCAPDCNGNGIPDSCDIIADTSQDCDGNNVPDECEPDVHLTVLSDPSQGGSTTPTGTTNHRPCTVVPLAAQANEGLCFTSWTVNAGAAPADPAAAETSVLADVDKTVVAQFTPVIVQQPQNITVCEDQAAALSVQLYPDYAATASYQWRHEGTPLSDGGAIDGATEATLHIDPVAPAHAGTYTCLLTYACGSTITLPAILSVDLLPRITENPAAQAVCPGTTVAFHVTATGTGLTYQWQFDADDGFADLHDAANVTGTQTHTLTLTGVNAAAAGQYRCIVAGICGSPVISAPATLTVHAVVQLASQPADQFACPGETKTFSVAASGSDLTYQWQFDSGSGFTVLEDGPNVSGATASTLTLSGITAADQGRYRCVVFGLCGPPATSSPAILTVGEFAYILAGPADQFACPGDAATFAVSAGGTGRTCRWQFDAGGGFADLADDGNISGADTSTLSIAAVQSGHAGQYRCVVWGNCGSPIVSTSATLSVGAPAVIHTQPTNQSLCPGSSTEFHVEATGTNLTYLWQFNPGPAFQNVVDDGNITGAATASLHIAQATTPHAGQYRCIVFAACGPALVSSAAQLTMTETLCDCNQNGIPDGQDIAQNTSQDCDGNGIPDECDLSQGAAQDCNSNGVPDQCDLSAGTSVDCNANGTPDECDLSSGASADCNADGIPDECQLAGNDCNHNGVPDECDPPYVADAGAPFEVCVRVTSSPMGGTIVATGSKPPYTYLWQITSGPSGGASILSPTSERPRFFATSPGVFEVTLTVSDASNPPCIATDTVLVAAREVTVAAGPGLAMCASATSAALSPVVTGGAQPYVYQWSVEPGSPSTSPSQFTGSGPQSTNPTFTPDVGGQYVLRLTVADSGNPACVATATVAVSVADLAIQAPADFTMCAGGESAPLTVTVVSRGTEPLSYIWTIDPGSPSLDPSQFGGAGPTSPNPTFRPNSPGQYILHATVRDSGTPPCERTAAVAVTAQAMTVDAGETPSICVGSSVRLAPSVQGGLAPLAYLWSIESGSPSTDPHQFQDPHQSAASPLFVPVAAGTYRLRLTVSDSGSPPCVSSDDLLVQTFAISANAGADFVTPAFAPSQPLGGSPLVVAGKAPYTYRWEIVGGPERSSVQLNATNVEHPLFTPAAVGQYEIKVTVTDANGCTAAAAVAIDAIASALRLRVNNQGLAFITLQLDAPHTRAEVRLSQASSGALVEAELLDADPSADFGGLLPMPALHRRLDVASELQPGSFVAVIVMHYSDDELGGLDPADLRLTWLSEPQQWWHTPGTGSAELGPYPLRPARADLGRHGVDAANHCVWVVLDYLGGFAIGIPSGESAPASDLLGTQTGGGGRPMDAASPQSSPPLCGAAGGCGTGIGAPLVCLLCPLFTRSVRIRRRSLRHSHRLDLDKPGHAA